MKFRLVFLLASTLAAGAGAQTPSAAPPAAGSQQTAPAQATSSPPSGAPAHGGHKGGQKANAFREHDTNHDGVIDRNEVKGGAGAQARFDRADVDKDGRVTAEEARAARRAKKSGGAASS